MRFLLSEKNAHRIAVILQSICYLIAILAVLVCVTILLGRVEISLTTPQGHYDQALLLEKDHSVTSRMLFTTISDQPVFLTTNGSVGFLTWLFISLIGILRVFPLGFVFFLLARFFGNISEAKVFVTRNANLLLKCGIVLLAAFVVTPVLNGFVFPMLLNRLTANRLTISSSWALTDLFFGAVLLVSAYVFHYGIHLQDEADHTL